MFKEGDLLIAVEDYEGEDNPRGELGPGEPGTRSEGATRTVLLLILFAPPL